MAGSGSKSGSSTEQVVADFRQLRQEQCSMAAKVAELEMEISEHSLVIDTLKEVDPSCKCYRLVGGVLVERTVKEVLPVLQSNKEQISILVETFNAQMQTKGQELSEYRERYSIRLVSEKGGPATGTMESPCRSEGCGTKSGVLVS